MTEIRQTTSHVQAASAAEQSHPVQATPVLMLAPPRAGLGLPTGFEVSRPPQLGSRLQCQADGHIDGGQVHVQGCPDFGQFVSGLAQAGAGPGLIVSTLAGMLEEGPPPAPHAARIPTPERCQDHGIQGAATCSPCWSEVKTGDRRRSDVGRKPVPHPIRVTTKVGADE